MQGISHIAFIQVDRSFNDTTFLQTTLAIFLNFFDLNLVLTVTAFCTSPELRTSPRYENLFSFSIILPFSVMSQSSSAFPAEPEYFLHIKSTYYLAKALSYWGAFLCIQLLHLIDRMKLLPFALLQTEQGCKKNRL